MIDFSIIGGGIVGLSIAWRLKSRHPDASVLVLEKETAVASHQSGRNSGVIHAGIYYEPGSLKARFCKAGVAATIEFCEDHGIPYEQCGKLIVATNDLELGRLAALFERARVNELDVVWLDAGELRAEEPNITGVAAILLHTTGIVDYAVVAEKMAQLFRQQGGDIRFAAEVTAIQESCDRVSLTLASGERIESAFVVACAGLQSDRIARMQGLDIDFRIVPYRGEYYRLRPDKNGIVKHLIYPVPDPELPFLGVHLTRMIDGSVTVGPSALQGWKREGYDRLNFSLKDTWELLTYSGFWRATLKYLGTGFREIGAAIWKPAYVRRVNKYCPSISIDDLEPYPVGIRATAVKSDGSMIHDFLIAETERSLHVCNAVSPAATSAIPIGDYICDRLGTRLNNLHE